MIELLPSLLIAVAAFVLFHKQADAHIQAIRDLNAAHAAERAELLTRIQAPELAPTLTPTEPSDEPLYVPFDDDEAYTEYAKSRAAGELQ